MSHEHKVTGQVVSRKAPIESQVICLSLTSRDKSLISHCRCHKSRKCSSSQTWDDSDACQNLHSEML